MTNIILPAPNQKVSANLVNPRMLLLYGPPKIGKTTICSNLPNSLLIDLEDGSGYVDSVKIKASSLAELNDIGGEIIKQDRPYEYIIIDTLTEMENWCEADATTMYKQDVKGKNFHGESVLSLANGGGYLWLRLSYSRYFNALRKLPTKALIGIAHVRDKFIVDKKGRETEAGDLDLTGKLKSITCSRADAIGYLYRKEAGIEAGKMKHDLWISFNSAEVATGTRSKHLINTDFKFDWQKIFLPGIIS